MMLRVLVCPFPISQVTLEKSGVNECPVSDNQTPPPLALPQLRVEIIMNIYA